MAVYKRRYDPYRGQLTARWSRWGVLTRYALRQLFASRFFLAFFIACLIPVLAFAVYIFVANSEVVRSLVALASQSLSLDVGKKFFIELLETEGFFAFLLTCWAAPTLVAGDLSNGALPLFLSRPFRRAEYIAGKFAVLGILLSCLMWVPALALFFLEAGLSPNPWLRTHLWMIGPILWCSFVWVVLLSFLALATSAWVKWRIIAMGAIFGLFLIPSGLGAALDAIVGTNWGQLLNPMFLFHEVVYTGFRGPVAAGSGITPVPVAAAWIALGVVALGSLQMLRMRLRAFEVVRG